MPARNRDGEGDVVEPAAVSRRRLLRRSVAAGAGATTLGRVGAARIGSRPQADAPTVYVFNTGDGTASLIDPSAPEVVATVHLGTTSSFPSNQYAPRLADSREEVLWLTVDGGVEAVGLSGLETVASHETGAAANWLERTPDGEHLVVSAREPVHRNYRLDADPASASFGEVTAEIDRRDEPAIEGEDGPGPCDVTIHPDGEYAYVPDRYGNTLTVLGIDPFEIRTQVAVDPVDDADHARPWMATASWDGDLLTVENEEGERGTESVWDVSDPAGPVERTRLTADDGLGESPLTSEIGPDGEVAYVFTPGTADVTVVDLGDGAVVDRLDLGGEAFTGTWGPDRERLFAPVQTEDEVAVIDHERGTVAERLPVGAAPYGATASSARPRTDALDEVLARLAADGVVSNGAATHCIGRCGCPPDG
ncbi:hypothetical protein [Salinilacihabitans rarus]|uniref:hypothetical protein n=1 Tax=Salinilacihabitans rarus TaxID=2961596 RepID=UPI0020C83E50|nr:hypothetical protein [Salinilacihabitans rarus]